MPEANTPENTLAGAVKLDVLIDGKPVDEQEVVAVAVDLDLNQPDMAVCTLKNAGNRHSYEVKQGQSVEIKLHDDGKVVFKGEVVGIEPVFKAGAESKVVIRAFNKLHRLLRGRKSRTFQDMSDSDIVGKVAKDHGLNPQCGSDVNIKHKHVYQHNQTDLEFLRTRAARIGYAVWVEDTKLFFAPPKLKKDSQVVFDMIKNPNVGHRIKSFAPRMSSAAVVKKVTVRGWDPEKKKEIVGEAEAQNSPLGKTNAAAAITEFGEIKTFTVDHPIASIEEAKAIAKARLDEAMLSYITGEAEVFGNAEYKPGLIVKVVVNDEHKDDKFNGMYLVSGCTHRYIREGTTTTGGYTTLLKLARNAEQGE